MSRLVVAFVALALASSVRAEEVEVKSASVAATSMKKVRRIDFEASSLANVIVRPWARADAQFVATKTAADKAALDVMRVEVSVVGDVMSIRLGERVNGTWGPLRERSRIDLAIDLPARLMGIPKRPAPLEPTGAPNGVATR